MEMKRDSSALLLVYICMEMAGGGRKRRCSVQVNKFK